MHILLDECLDWLPGIDRAGRSWKFPIMKASIVDERRRIVIPAQCPPHSAVAIQQIDENSWLIRRQVPDQRSDL